jgi:serine O-acetyltransferase
MFEHLREDLISVRERDPAARSILEVLTCYAGVHALIFHRLAHAAWRRRLYWLGRFISYIGRFFTGIEIHPAAVIGRRVFIDHGTGVVIGETCVIGDNVKLYQGVTLGAKSFATDADGNLVRGQKRHPNIEDNVVIYSGASILGGDVTVGRNSVIGGNAWIVKSVPENTLAYNPSPAVVTNAREEK